VPSDVAYSNQILLCIMELGKSENYRSSDLYTTLAVVASAFSELRASGRSASPVLVEAPPEAPELEPGDAFLSVTIAERK